MTIDVEAVMADPVELVFTNSDARPKVETIRIDQASIPLVMAWYGAFYAGDRYTVHANGVKLEKDINGELKAHAHIKGDQS